MPEADAKEIVTTRKRRYLVAVRSAPGVMQPMAAEMLSNQLSAIEGVEVVKRIKPRGFGALSSGLELSTSSVPEIIVANMDVERGEALRRQAAGNPTYIVEEDALLRHFGVEETSQRIALNQVAATLSPPTTGSFEVRFQVVDGTNGKPIPNVTVTVYGMGFPAQGKTDNKGQVDVSVFADSIQSIRAIYLKASSNYWERFVERPALELDAVNVVPMNPLSQTFPNFPATGVVGWGQRSMQLDQLGQSLTGRGVKVGIIDSGCDNKHPQLARVQAGIDFTNGKNDASWISDEISHGTHCAGIIGAAGAQGIRGFAPEAELIPLKVFPGGRFSDLIDALDECIQRGIDVVNLSLGSDQSSELVARKVKEALDQGLILVVAAGNSGGPVQFPGWLPGVITVSAVGKLNEFPADTYHAQNVLPGGIGDIFPAKFSCFGPQIKVCGPGVAIISCVPGGGYAAWDGTSMAAPHITGLAALILAHHPSFQGQGRQRSVERSARLLQILQSVAMPCVTDVARAGAGLPNAQASVGPAGQPSAGAGLPTPSPQPPGGSRSNLGVQPGSSLGGQVGGAGQIGGSGGPIWVPGIAGQTQGWPGGSPPYADSGWDSIILANPALYQAMLFSKLRAAGLV